MAVTRRKPLKGTDDADAVAQPVAIAGGHRFTVIHIAAEMPRRTVLVCAGLDFQPGGQLLQVLQQGFGLVHDDTAMLGFRRTPNTPARNATARAGPPSIQERKKSDSQPRALCARTIAVL